MLKVTMRGLVLATLAVCAIATTASAQPTVTRFKANGDAADAYFESGSLWCSVYVGRGGTAQNVQTYLAYGCHNGSTFILAGSGLIPNKSLQGSFNHLSLEVDTSTVAGFNHEAGSGGVISLQWSKDGLYQAHSSGVSRATTPGFVRHQSGTWSQASATVSGSLLGNLPTEFLYANVIQNNSVAIEIEKNQ